MVGLCGIAGYITKKEYKLNTHQKGRRKKILRGLMVANQERGNHSAGVAIVDKSNDALIAKKAKPAIKFVYSNDFDNILTFDHYIVIGHTRLATVGAVNQENAHPFNKHDITGVHNGMIYNWQEINTLVNVDSEVIFELLDEHQNDYKKSFAKLAGLFAIVWHYNGDDGIYLVRSGNPLAISYIKELKTYFFSSEEKHLTTVIASHVADKFSWWTPKSDKVYRIDGELKVTKENVKFKEERLWDYSGGKRKRNGKKKKGKKNKEKTIYIEADGADYWEKEERQYLEKQRYEYVYAKATQNGCDECHRQTIHTCYYSDGEDLVVCEDCYLWFCRDERADYVEIDLIIAPKIKQKTNGEVRKTIHGNQIVEPRKLIERGQYVAHGRGELYK